MTKGFFAAAFMVLAIALLAPVSALAQAQWGEPINTPDRFVVLASYNNEAVYDKETGLVWEQVPGPTAVWPEALFRCNQKRHGNRKGWRLPTIQELASLIDPTVFPGLTLPAGHPFQIAVGSSVYWSASTLVGDTTQAWVVNFLNSDTGGVTGRAKSDVYWLWCVRGGQGVDPQ